MWSPQSLTRSIGLKLLTETPKLQHKGVLVLINVGCFDKLLRMSRWWHVQWGADA